MPIKSEEAKARHRKRMAEINRERQKNDVQYQTDHQIRNQKGSSKNWTLGNMWLVMVDGEADNDGHYDQLAGFNGQSFYDKETPGQDITLLDTLWFLRSISKDLKRLDKTRRSNVFMMFSKHYDEDKWIGAEPRLTKEQKQAITAQRSRNYGIHRTPGWQREIILENVGLAVYFGRKETVIHWLEKDINGDIRYDENGQPVIYYTQHIWDTWSLSAKSFIKTIEPLFASMTTDEQIHYKKMFDLVVEGKAERGEWSDNFDYERRKQYNHAELELMYYWINHIIEGCKRSGIAPKSLAGPAPFARSILYKYGAAKHVQPEDYKTIDYQQSDFVQQTKVAYFGGRIESRLQGVVNSWTELDITSAYPAIIRDLPCMAHGHWEYSTPDTSNIVDTAIYHIKFTAPYGTLWGPFPVRNKYGGIVFPLRGEGYYYGIEVKAALPYTKISFLGMSQWISECDCKTPFQTMIDEMFDLRAKMIAQKDDAASLVIKLSLNSIYGLFAQTAGAALVYDEITGHLLEYKLPKFYNLFGAGYITASVRAQLYSALMKCPEKVIGIATDALHIIGDVPEEISNTLIITDDKHKTLGTWTIEKYNEPTAFVMPGIRTIKIPNNASKKEIEHLTNARKSRGYPFPLTFDEIVSAWSNGIVRLTKTRKVYQDLRSSKLNPKQWGKFIEQSRDFDIGPDALAGKRDTTKPIKMGAFTIYPPDETIGKNYSYQRHFEKPYLAIVDDKRSSSDEEITLE